MYKGSKKVYKLFKEGGIYVKEETNWKERYRLQRKTCYEEIKGFQREMGYRRLIDAKRE